MHVQRKCSSAPAGRARPPSAPPPCSWWQRRAGCHAPSGGLPPRAAPPRRGRTPRTRLRGGRHTRGWRGERAGTGWGGAQCVLLAPSRPRTNHRLRVLVGMAAVRVRRVALLHEQPGVAGRPHAAAAGDGVPLGGHDRHAAARLLRPLGKHVGDDAAGARGRRRRLCLPKHAGLVQLVGGGQAAQRGQGWERARLKAHALQPLVQPALQVAGAAGGWGMSGRVLCGAQWPTRMSSPRTCTGLRRLSPSEGATPRPRAVCLCACSAACTASVYQGSRPLSLGAMRRRASLACRGAAEGLPRPLPRRCCFCLPAEAVSSSRSACFVCCCFLGCLAACPTSWSVGGSASGSCRAGAARWGRATGVALPTARRSAACCRSSSARYTLKVAAGPSCSPCVSRRGGASSTAADGAAGDLARRLRRVPGGGLQQGAGEYRLKVSDGPQQAHRVAGAFDWRAGQLGWCLQFVP